MCRMLIGYPNKDRSLGFGILKSCSILISLGKNSTTIDPKGLQRTIKALQKCNEILREYPKIEVQCIATAIFRSAHNAQEILDYIYDKCGFSFRISDPSEEIMFSACGCRNICLDGLSFVMDMGGGSTEIGFFEKTKDSIELLDWISLPYGLFYFGSLNKQNKSIPTDSYKALSVFLEDKRLLVNQEASLIICRSGVMTLISAYICRRHNVLKSSIYGRVFDINYIMKVINALLDMSDTDIIEERLISNTSHISSTRGTLTFTREILRKLPIQVVILGNGGVKEGMMNLACARQ